MLERQGAVRVLADTQQREEGKSDRAPYASGVEVHEVESAPDGEEVLQRQRRLGTDDVVATYAVLEALDGLLQRDAAVKLTVAEISAELRDGREVALDGVD